LLWQVGGPDTMTEQIGHLRTAAARPNISLNVLPLSSGAHAAMKSAFVISQFPDPDQDPSVVYLDNRAAFTAKTSRHHRYDTIFHQVLDQSIPILGTCNDQHPGTTLLPQK
jgi:hypothetical protein